MRKQTKPDRKSRPKGSKALHGDPSGPVLLTVEELASAVEMDPQLLRNYVAAGGIIEPVVRGSKGRGKPHQFSCQQAIGLAMAMACVDAGYFTMRGQVREVVEGFTTAPWDRLEAWYGMWKTRNDPYQQESRAANKDLNLSPDWTDILPKQIVQDAARRMLKVFELIETKAKKQRAFEELREGLVFRPAKGRRS
jgi:hypothetical protein